MPDVNVNVNVNDVDLGCVLAADAVVDHYPAPSWSACCWTLKTFCKLCEKGKGERASNPRDATHGPLQLVVPVLRSCQSPIRIWIIYCNCNCTCTDHSSSALPWPQTGLRCVLPPLSAALGPHVKPHWLSTNMPVCRFWSAASAALMALALTNRELAQASTGVVTHTEAAAQGLIAPLRRLRFRAKEADSNDGDEVNEGNDGVAALPPTRADGGNKGDDGVAGNEGASGDEVDEGDTGGGGASGDEGDEGDEGNEGMEGDEGNEGDEGGSFTAVRRVTISAVICTSQATAQAFSAMENAHKSLISTIFTEFCRDDVDAVSAVDVALAASDAALAFTRAVVATQAACVSTGMAFGCASASTMAEAWVSATAEAHASTVAASAEDCNCLAKSQALSVGSASTFITLTADAFARAEVTACSKGNDASFAAAFADCSAFAYATIWTHVRLRSFHSVHHIHATFLYQGRRLHPSLPVACVCLEIANQASCP